MAKCVYDGKGDKPDCENCIDTVGAGMVCTHDCIIELREAIAAKDKEIEELNRKIADYERMLASSPIGLIYQLGICNQDGEVMNGIGLLLNNEAEGAKMPRVSHGDRFYIVPLEYAKIEKEV